jgi:hypothetical protein
MKNNVPNPKTGINILQTLLRQTIIEREKRKEKKREKKRKGKEREKKKYYK